MPHQGNVKYLVYDDIWRVSTELYIYNTTTTTANLESTYTSSTRTDLSSTYTSSYAESRSTSRSSSYSSTSRSTYTGTDYQPWADGFTAGHTGLSEVSGTRSATTASYYYTGTGQNSYSSSKTEILPDRRTSSHSEVYANNTYSTSSYTSHYSVYDNRYSTTYTDETIIWDDRYTENINVRVAGGTQSTRETTYSYRTTGSGSFSRTQSTSYSTTASTSTTAEGGTMTETSNWSSSTETTLTSYYTGNTTTTIDN